ncbi:MAG: hypothetical protein ACFFEY_00710 [Candidatus Thorarchaeota archaeon]
MAKVFVRCPICSKWDKIEISDDATKNVTKGLLAINIASGMICEHSFIAYVDKNLSVRDCLVADFKIELPEGKSSGGTNKTTIADTETIKFDLIKLNISEILLANILRAIFFGKKILIILEQEFLFNHVKNFFKNIMDKTFDFNFNLLQEMDYKKNKNEFKEHIVLKNREIIRDEQQIIDQKGLEFEKNIVQKFFNEYDLTAGLIILRNEIKRIYELSRSVGDFIKNNEGKLLIAKNIIKHLSEKHKEKVQISYLKFLLNIVQNYFKIDIPKIEGVSNLLGLL